MEVCSAPADFNHFINYFKFSKRKAVPFIFHNVDTGLTVDNSGITEAGFELGARDFSLMMECGTPKHVRETVNIYNE